MPRPWDFDYRLSPSAVEALARACGLRGEPCPLGAGWDYATFVCDGQVLRIPKRAETAAVLPKELELLRSLPADLPLVTPRPARDLVRVDLLPYASMVYAFIAGTPLDACDLEPRAARIGAQLGEFLRALHSLPLPAAPIGDRSLDARRNDAIAKLAPLVPELGESLVTRLLERLNESLPPLRSEYRLCHADLLAEHILVGDRGDAVAVIDWGDAGAAPWWSDFVGLWLWGDDEALRAALAAYGRSLDGGERAHLQRLALLAAIDQCYYELQRDDASWTHEAAAYLERLL